MGIDQAKGMLARARAKANELAVDAQERITVLEANVIGYEWPHGFDLVILGGNCLYELATPQEQEQCIASAAMVLGDGGQIYVGNNHLEGELDESWRQPKYEGSPYQRGRWRERLGIISPLAPARQLGPESWQRYPAAAR